MGKLETKEEVVGELSFHIIYKQPEDYPDKYVVVSYGLDEEGIPKVSKSNFLFGDTLEEAREKINISYPGANKVERYPELHPQIVEMWVNEKQVEEFISKIRGNKE